VLFFISMIGWARRVEVLRAHELCLVGIAEFSGNNLANLRRLAPREKEELDPKAIIEKEGNASKQGHTQLPKSCHPESIKRASLSLILLSFLTFAEAKS
jgi:hypothetical protein